MKTITLGRLALLALALTSFASCHSSDAPLTSTPSPAETSQKTSLSLSLEATTDSPVYSSEDEASQPSSLRSLGLTFDTNHPKYLPHITLSQTSLKTRLFFRKKDSTDPADFFALSFTDEIWKTRKMTASGIYLSVRGTGADHHPLTFDVPAGKHTPQAGEVWEVAAILGDGDTDPSPAALPATGAPLHLTSPRYAIAIEDGDKHTIPNVSMDIPYASDWQDVTFEEGMKLTAHLHFKCIGALFHYRVERGTNVDKGNNGSPWNPTPLANPEQEERKFTFRTSIADLLGTYEFTQTGTQHWQGKPSSPQSPDMEENMFILPTTVKLPPTTAIHVLIFGVPKSGTIARSVTSLQVSIPSPRSHQISLNKDNSHPSKEPYYSNLPAVVAGKVHYAKLYSYTFGGSAFPGPPPGISPQ